jgi:hypothetical protein
MGACRGVGLRGESALKKKELCYKNINNEYREYFCNKLYICPEYSRATNRNCLKRFKHNSASITTRQFSLKLGFKPLKTACADRHEYSG